MRALASRLSEARFAGGSARAMPVPSGARPLALKASRAGTPGCACGGGCPKCSSRFPSPLFDKGVREVEVGHTDCDWDRAVKADEPYRPRSGKIKTKVAGDVCTQPCTLEHEATHVEQVQPVCTTYFDCYTGASARAKGEKDCKEISSAAERKRCEDLYTELYQLQCFEAVSAAWDAEKWECDAYKRSLACAQKELPKAGADCKDKLKEYEASAKKQIAKYCAPEKKADEPKKQEKPAAPPKK